MYLEGDAELPAGMEMEVPPPPVPEEAPKLLNRLMEDLAAGDYDKVVAEAVPAAARYPTMKEEFESLAAIAVDQKRRADEVALAREEEKPDKYFFYMRPSDRWPNRQDDRKGILMGFDLGLSTGVRLEWKIGGQVVDGIGLKVGVGVGTYSGSVGLTVSALPLYIDFNIAREWQIELGLGGVLFPTGYSSVYPMAQAALQWDPSSPIQVTAGVGLHIYGVVPEANVGFLW